MGLLEAKVALISGSGGGQGRAAALAFAREGARIVGCDLIAEESERTVELVRAAGGEMIASAPVDISDPDAATAWVGAAMDRFGRIDIVYNNAGSPRFGLIADMSVEDWRATLASELDTVFFVTRAAWPHLVSGGGGVILNTASMAGMLGFPSEMAAHCAAKGGVIGITRQMAIEGAPVGVRAVAISPGPISNAIVERAMAEGQAIYTEIVERTLLKRWGRPEEVAELAAFLASDRASYITGANYVIDGGATAS